MVRLKFIDDKLVPRIKNRAKVGKSLWTSSVSTTAAGTGAIGFMRPESSTGEYVSSRAKLLENPMFEKSSCTSTGSTNDAGSDSPGSSTESSPSYASVPQLNLKNPKMPKSYVLVENIVMKHERLQRRLKRHVDDPSKVSITLHKSSSSQVHHHHEIKKNKKESPKRERKEPKQKTSIQTSKENINAPQAGPSNQLLNFKIPKLDRAELSKMREAVPMSSASRAFCQANYLNLGLLEDLEFRKYVKRTSTISASVRTDSKKRYCVQRGPGSEAEHADMNDPEWLKYENFSHNERIQHARDTFKNNDPAVPTESLTYFGGRRRLQENAADKRLFSPPDLYSCDLFDGQIVASNNCQIFYGQPEDGVAHQVGPREVRAKEDSISFEEVRSIYMMHLYTNFLKSTKHNKNGDERDRRNFNCLTSHLLAGLTELEQYLTLYMGPEQAGVPVSMVRRALEADNQFLSFPNYYGPRPELRCRLAKCEEQHWFAL